MPVVKPRPTSQRKARGRLPRRPLPVRTPDRNPGEAAHSRAYVALKEAVLAGHFRPGEVITLRALAKDLSMGEMPVREALRRLTSEGAFEGLPNRSARVPTLDRRQLEQIIELRQQLEGKAAALAARNITLVQIEHLRAVQTAIEKSLSAGDMHTFTALNMAFHFEIYRIADNPVLVPLIQMLWLRMAPLVANTVTLLNSTSSHRRFALGNHERLLEAFQARDPAAAEDAMRRDLVMLNKMPGYWESLPITAS